MTILTVKERETDVALDARSKVVSSEANATLVSAFFINIVCRWTMSALSILTHNSVQLKLSERFVDLHFINQGLAYSIKKNEVSDVTLR